MLDAGILELLCIGCISNDAGDVLTHIIQPDFIQVARIIFNNDGTIVFFSQRGNDFVAGLAKTANQVERFVQGPHMFLES